MLHDDFIAECKLNHFAETTVESYWSWCKQYFKFTNFIHPKKLLMTDVERFLKHLAVDRKLSLSSQDLAFNSLLFLYKKVLRMRFKIKKSYRVKKPETVPTVLTQEEVRNIINAFEGQLKLVTELLYGCGMRKNEALNLRINDIDLGNKIIYIKQGKGQKDRIAYIPETILNTLESQIKKVENLFNRDTQRKFNGTFLPDSIKNKNPQAALEFGWQYLFPSKDLVKSKNQRYHVHESTYDKALKAIASYLGIHKHVHPHCFRHSYATHLIEAGQPITVVQELLGHKSVKTTMIYTHVTQKQIKGYVSPLDWQSKESPALKIYKIAQQRGN